jgi:hypothetical protein
VDGSLDLTDVVDVASIPNNAFVGFCSKGLLVIINNASLQYLRNDI